jgi:hypothetical protein
VQYGDLDIRIVPRSRCSLMIFLVSSCSSCVSGRSLPGRVAGAPGSSSIAWSHTENWGKRWDAASLKTFACRWYSCGTSGIGSGLGCFGGWIVTLPMKYCSHCIGLGMFRVRGVNTALFVSTERRTIGSWE